ncbi:MAG TPA: hypothetical protein VFS05_15260, partial [Gemmatimonadaceae bacterium]|nr:hypothetical protein [Gemmatimonadaceae bacterium]
MKGAAWMGIVALAVAACAKGRDERAGADTAGATHIAVSGGAVVPAESTAHSDSAARAAPAAPAPAAASG